MIMIARLFSTTVLCEARLRVAPLPCYRSVIWMLNHRRFPARMLAVVCILSCAAWATAEPLELTLPERAGITRDTLWRHYYVPTLNLHATDTEAIQSATFRLLLGPIIVVDVTSASAAFTTTFEQTEQWTEIHVQRVSGTSANQDDPFVKIVPDIDEIGNLGMGFGHLQFIGVDVTFVDGEEREILTRDGSWYHLTDAFSAVSVQAVSPAGGDPVSGVRISVVGINDLPDIFAHFDDDYLTDAEGRVEIPVPSVRLTPDRRDFTLHFRVEPPPESPFRSGVVSIPVTSAEIGQIEMFEPAIVSLEEFSAVEAWRAYP